MSVFRRLLVEALKVAFVAWSVVGLDPSLEQNLPDWHPIWRYLLGAAVAAFLLEVFLQLILGRPGIDLHWKIPGDPVEPTSELVLKISNRNLVGQPVDLTIISRNSGWLSYAILRLVSRGALQLQIRVEQSSLKPYVEYSSDIAGRLLTEANDGICGFEVEMSSAPSRPGLWREAQVRWTAPRLVEDKTYNVDYSFKHPHPFLQLMLTFWTRESNVQSIRLVRR